MRLNDTSLKQLARTIKVDLEGRMLYRAPKESYRERWFRLKGNLLFYCRTTSSGAMLDPDPLGILVVDSCLITIEPLGDRPFVFSILFTGDDRKHFFSCQNMKQCEDWVRLLRSNSALTLRKQINDLRMQIHAAKGRDPLDDMVTIPTRSSATKRVVVCVKPSLLKSDVKPSSLNLIPCEVANQPSASSSSLGNSTFHTTLPSPRMKHPQSIRPKPPSAFSIDRLGNATRQPAKGLNSPSSPGPDLIQLSPPAVQTQKGLILNPAQLQTFQGWETFE